MSKIYAAIINIRFKSFRSLKKMRLDGVKKEIKYFFLLLGNNIYYYDQNWMLQSYLTNGIYYLVEIKTLFIEAKNNQLNS